jgi:patatin-related protein
MNGGVSLAVWMSGVTREIDRLRRHDGPYGKLLDLVQATARVDVIAGASAGGLAGTLLGLAVATESELSSALNLWVERGGFKAMVRDPLEPDPPSILRGDDYFLGEVKKALGTIAKGAGNYPTAGGAPDAKDHDLHVIITTTALSGEPNGYPDYFETLIRDVDHRQAFRFRRTREPERNDFGVDDRALSRLALAARTTSSFPGAFEPSFISVANDGADALHPAMKDIATFEHDRWAVDGGILVNTPFGRALEAIKTIPATREVRRVLMYIVASTGTPQAAKDDKRDGMPTLRDVVMDALSDLPRVQSFREELEEIAEINQRSAERKRARRELLIDLGSDQLGKIAGRLLQAYANIRTESAVDDVRKVVAETVAKDEAAPSATIDADTLRKAVPIPGPQTVPEAGGDAEWADEEDVSWTWGIAPVEYGANVVLDLLREALTLPEAKSMRPTFRRLRGELHQQLADLRRLQRENREFWESRARSLAEGVTDETAETWRQAHGEAAGTIALELGRIAADCATSLPGWDDDGDPPNVAVALARALVPPTTPADDRKAAAVQTFLSLHIVQRVAGSDLAGIEQSVDLVQLSADAENSFDGRERASDKLAGLQLHHFGAFYKRSWRANDWLWGRLDGAERLVQIVLDPPRLRRLAAEEGLTAAKAADLILEIATSDATEAEAKYLTSRVKIEHLRTELEFLDDQDKEVPKRLPKSWRAVATGIQWRILHEELLGLAAAARADRDEKCFATSTGALWAQELPPDRILSPKETVDQFGKCFIGTERIEQEVETDYFTALVSKTGAVTGSVLKGKYSGLPKPARRIATFLRGILVALYLLARGVTSGSRFGMFVVALMLAIGGAFLALTLIANPPALITALGTILVLAGFGLAFLRGGGLWFALATLLAIVAIAVVAYLVERNESWFDGLPNWVERLLPVVPIVVLATLTMLLGLVHGRPKTPARARG